MFFFRTGTGEREFLVTFQSLGRLLAASFPAEKILLLR